MREEEERRREKVLQSAGIHLGAQDQAPIANLESAVERMPDRDPRAHPVSPLKGEGISTTHQVDVMRPGDDQGHAEYLQQCSKSTRWFKVLGAYQENLAPPPQLRRPENWNQGCVCLKYLTCMRGNVAYPHLRRPED